jgi:autotransporter-associated beta strand protein
MNGHTLTFALDNYIGFGEITVAEGDHGKMVLSSGIVEWIRGGGSATGLDVETTGDAALKLGTGGNASFHDLTYSSTYWQKNGVAAYLAIYGTYAAGSVRPPLMMQDGSAIDLSAIDGVFDTSGTSVTHVASIVTGITGQVAFVDKASIALDMGDRAFAVGDCLLSWEAGVYPNASFQFSLHTNGVAVADKSLVIKNSADACGVYVKDAREPAYAKWVNGAWKYFSDRTHEYDGEWTQGITDTMQVLFSSVEEYNLICTTNFSPAPAAFVLTGFTGARNVTTDLTQLPFLFDEGAVLDVKGGHVKLPGSMAGSTTAFTVTNSAEQTGTLEVDVADGTTTNTKMALAGNLKFVKSGAGTFVSTLAQTYTGGTLVAEGTVQEPANSVAYGGEGDFTVYGTGAITVESNATFTVQSAQVFKNDIVLAGGRLYGNLNSVVARITAVTADSQVEMMNGNDVSMHIGASGSHLDLDGHTLTFSGGTGSQYFYIDASLEGETGGFVFDSSVEYVGKLPADGNGVDVEINVRAHMFDPASVHDYKIAGSQNQWGTGTAYGLNVYGTFTPISTTFYGCTMMNGSTIDLSGKTGVWSVQSSIPNAANNYGLTAAQQTARKTVSFADNATVKIKLGERKVKAGDKVVDWTGKTPANLATLRFTSAEGEHFGLQKKDDGLYIIHGFIILVR